MHRTALLWAHDGARGGAVSAQHHPDKLPDAANCGSRRSTIAPPEPARPATVGHGSRRSTTGCQTTARARSTTDARSSVCGSVPNAAPQSPPSRDAQNASATSGGAQRTSSDP
ncbi:hypothetical protein QFZ67_001688 [Streptomyces sp. V1I1]|nr:hypothetical protein [Streptomyces sp. V1I1]